jgi:hypothetical protein
MEHSFPETLSKLEHEQWVALATVLRHSAGAKTFAACISGGERQRCLFRAHALL